MAGKFISEKQREANKRRAAHLRKLGVDPAIREKRKQTGRRVMKELNSDPAFRAKLMERRKEVGVTDRMRENGRVMMMKNRQSPPKGQWGGGKTAKQADPRLAVLSTEQRKIYKKLRGNGIGKEEALEEVSKP